MRVVSIINDKGGVGKTLLAGLIVDAALILLYRVLVIDLDPQGTLSCERLGLYENNLTGASYITTDSPSLADFLKRRGDIHDYIVGIPKHPLAPQKIDRPEDFRLNVIWPGYDLSDTLESLDPSRLREGYDAIEDFIEQVRRSGEFDIIIIDNPPNRSGLSRRLAEISDAVVIPSVPEPGCYEASLRTVETIQKPHCIIAPNRYQTETEIRAVHEEYLGLLQKLKNRRVEIAETLPQALLYQKYQANGYPILLHYHWLLPTTFDVLNKALGIKKRLTIKKAIKQAWIDFRGELTEQALRETKRSYPGALIHRTAVRPGRQITMDAELGLPRAKRRVRRPVEDH